EKSGPAEKNTQNADNDDWKRLKDFQRQERETFFADGKSAFSDVRGFIYAEVREEFRERWANYYAERKAGGDEEWLADKKAGLIAEQKEILEARRDEACAILRESRDAVYQGLLDEQRQTRAELRGRQG